MSNSFKRVIIIRHGEKLGHPAIDAEDDGPDLSPKGHVRASALAKYIPFTFGNPDFLFATAASKHSNRPVETIKPISKELGIEINEKYSDGEYQNVADEILGNPIYSGKLILICWHHGMIPKLISALGGIPPVDPWADFVFDRVWQVDIPQSNSGTKLCVNDIPQKVLFGDSDK